MSNVELFACGELPHTLNFMDAFFKMLLLFNSQYFVEGFCSDSKNENVKSNLLVCNQFQSEHSNMKRITKNF